ncbi:MAG: YkvA family protein [Flammeovirgaceae bacterium]
MENSLPKIEEDSSSLHLSLWEKIRKYAKKAGMPLIYCVLLLFYSLKDENVPKSAKIIITGTIGYFILPIDAIPDVLPLTGYSDDFGLIILALTQIAIYMTEETKMKAKEKLLQWFPDANASILEAIDRRIGQNKQLKK